MCGAPCEVLAASHVCHRPGHSLGQWFLHFCLDSQAIKKVYHKLALQWHPDKRSQSLCERQKHYAELRFKEVTEAKTVCLLQAIAEWQRVPTIRGEGGGGQGQRNNNQTE